MQTRLATPADVPAIAAIYNHAIVHTILLGVAWSKRWSPRQAYDLTCEVSIYIAPDAQGRGIGTLLYTDLFSRLAAIGYEHVLGREGSAIGPREDESSDDSRT